MINKRNLLQTSFQTNLFFWGSFSLLLSLIFGLITYFLQIPLLNYIFLTILLAALVLLIVKMQQDLHQEINSTIYTYILIGLVFIVYFSQRLALHHFDFSVVDASDYYLAGVSSVLNGDDIGFFLPLTASVSAIGFSLFGEKYTLFIMVLAYSISIPLVYFIFRKLNLSSILSFFMTLLTVSLPLSIWFSKTSFSEPIWQVLLLLLSLVLFKITSKEKINSKELTLLFAILFIVPFSRGDAVLLYAMVVVLSIYHFWKFNNLKSASILAASSIILTVAIHLTLNIRAKYLIDWQFSRVLGDITETELMTILYAVSFISIVTIFFLNLFKESFKRLNLPFIIVIFSILFKIIIAYVYSIKKHLLFTDLFIMNEFELALGHFGLLFTILIIIGLILLHFRAIKRDVLALILVLLYAIFYLPFTMQVATFNHEHEFFLYWNRYYFSIFMMIHIFALGMSINYIYNKLKNIIPHTLYRQLVFLPFIVIVSYYSINNKLYHIVTEEAYLENSYKLYPWISKKIGKKSLTVVYTSDIRFGNYDAKQLMRRGLQVSQINVKKYRKAKADKLDTELEFIHRRYKNEFVLCLSKNKYAVKNKNLILQDTISLPISWRRQDLDISKSKKINMQIYASLYKVNLKTKD